MFFWVSRVIGVFILLCYCFFVVFVRKLSGLMFGLNLLMVFGWLSCLCGIELVFRWCRLLNFYGLMRIFLMVCKDYCFCLWIWVKLVFVREFVCLKFRLYDGNLFVVMVVV